MASSTTDHSAGILFHHAEFESWYASMGYERYANTEGELALYMPRVLQGGKKNRSGQGWEPVAYLKPGDIDAMRNAIESHLDENTYGVYVSLALYVGGHKKENVVGITAFNLDIDVEGAAHPAGDVQDFAEAQTWLKALPVDPTVLTNTGNGLHALLLLDEPLTDLNLSAEIARGLVAFCEGEIDISPLRNWGTTNTRVGGCVNARLKADGPLVTATTTGAPISAGELHGLFPAPVVETPKRRENAHKYARDRFKANTCVAELASQLFGAKLERQFLNIPVDNQFSESPSVKHYHPDNGGTNKLTFCTLTDHGGRRLNLLAQNLPGGERKKFAAGTALSAFDLLQLKVGSFSAAVGLVEAFETTEGVFAMDEIVTHAADPEAAREKFSAKMQPRNPASVPTEAGDVDESPASVDQKFEAITASIQPETIAEAHARGESWSRTIQMGREKYLVRFSPHTEDSRLVNDTGIYQIKEKSTDGGSETTYIQVTDFVAMRESVEQLHDANITTYEAQPVYDSSGASRSRYTVTVYRRNSAPITRSGLSPSVSGNLSSIQEEFKCGLILPTTPTERAVVTNVLKLYDMSSSEIYLVPHTGWIRVGGKFVYTAPAGSVDATGKSQAPVRVVNTGMNGGPVPAKFAPLGYPNFPDVNSEQDAADIREALSLFRRSFSKRLYTVGLGYAISAAIPQEESGVLSFFARFSSGKTVLAKALLSFFSGAGLDNAEIIQFSLKSKNSTAGENVGLSFPRHSILVMDDYHPTSSKEKNNDLLNKAEGFVDGVFNRSNTIKSNLHGEMDVKRAPDTLGILTGEMVPPLGSGRMSRLAKFPMEEGDFVGYAGEQPYVGLIESLRRGDGFRKLMALCVQHLAEMLDRQGLSEVHGRFMDVRHEMKDRVADLTPPESTSRTMLVCSPFVSGLALMQMVAQKHVGTEVGRVIREMIPEQEDIETAYRRLVSENLKGLDATSVPEKIIEELRSRLEAMTAYLRPAGGVPDGDHIEYGLVRDSYGVVQPDPKGSLLIGDISADHKFVHLNSSAVKRVSEFLGNTMGDEELFDLMNDVLASGANKGGKSKPLREHFDVAPVKRNRGFTIDAARFGFEPQEDVLAENHRGHMQAPVPAVAQAR